MGSGLGEDCFAALTDVEPMRALHACRCQNVWRQPKNRAHTGNGTGYWWKAKHLQTRRKRPTTDRATLTAANVAGVRVDPDPVLLSPTVELQRALIALTASSAAALISAIASLASPPRAMSVW